jgi:uncharacterized protein (TIGR02466 family)
MTIPSTFYYWGPLLWQTKVSDEIVNGLLERGLKSNVSHRHQLVGYFKDEYSYSQNDMEWFINKTKPYFLKYKDISENEWYMTPSPPIHLTSLWINIMKAGDFNPPHTHDGELSFVIYLKVPPKLKEEYNSYQGRSPESNGAGVVSFISELNNKTRNINRKAFLPEVGDMFIFPATLTHFVAPFKCEGERISVSGNLIAR